MALTKNLADELGPHGIKVSVIHPGLVKTERRLAEFAAQAQARGISVEKRERQSTRNIAVRRWMTPEEIAHVITFLASPRSVAIVARGCGTLLLRRGAQAPAHRQNALPRSRCELTSLAVGLSDKPG